MNNDSKESPPERVWLFPMKHQYLHKEDIYSNVLCYSTQKGNDDIEYTLKSSADNREKELRQEIALALLSCEKKDKRIEELEKVVNIAKEYVETREKENE